MTCRFAAKVFDIEQGQHEIVLNEAEAKRMDMDLQDRVLLKFKKKTLTAMVDHSKHLVHEGEMGVFYETAQKLGIRSGDCLGVMRQDRPASLDFIRKKLDGGILLAQ